MAIVVELTLAFILGMAVVFVIFYRGTRGIEKKIPTRYSIHLIDGDREITLLDIPSAYARGLALYQGEPETDGKLRFKTILKGKNHIDIVVTLEWDR